MKYKRGYRMLTLGWLDGNSFIPVNHCLLSAADNKNLLCEAFVYDGRFNIKEVYSKNCKRRGRSKYLLSVNVTIGDEAIPAKIVCVCNKSKKKDWLAILSTDTSLSEEEIIRIYGKRWDIEFFFKSCKSYLRLVKECRSTSYDALNAHTAIVFTRYMMLSVAQRRNTDDKTLCELFFYLMDELDDITFIQSVHEDYYRRPYGFRYGILAYHRTGTGDIYC